jgi:hypothetical protein
MKDAAALFWYIALAVSIIIVTTRFFGDGWESWVLGLVAFGALAPFVPRFVERRRKLINANDKDADVQQDQKERGVRS